jgi:hypothetical protein
MRGKACRAASAAPGHAASECAVGALGGVLVGSRLQVLGATIEPVVVR